MSKTIEVETKTFVRFWLVIIGLALIGYFIYTASTGLIIVGISIFLAIAIKPLVARLNRVLGKCFGKKGEHKTASAVLAYVIVVATVSAIVAICGPVVINETVKFATQLPETLNNDFGGWDGVNAFGESMGIPNLQSQIMDALGRISESIVSNLGNLVVTSVGAIASLFTQIVLVLVLTLLFLLEGPGIMDKLWHSLDETGKNKSTNVARDIINKMTKVVSTYVSKQATVALLDGVVVCVVILALSLIFGFSAGIAVPMGLLAVVFYLIPMFGQIISCVLVSLMLLFSSPIAAVVFVVFYIVYSQVENNIIAPKIQGDALKLPAVAILVSITIGMYMFGLLGAIIAIPIAGCIRVFIDEYPRLRAAHKSE